MDIIITVGVLLGIAVYFIVFKMGNVKFWKQAAKNPNLAFDLISKDPTWIIDDGTKNVDSEKYNGPFLLYVPKLNATVKIYGEFDSIEVSQERIMEVLKNS